MRVVTPYLLMLGGSPLSAGWTSVSPSGESARSRMASVWLRMTAAAVGAALDGGEQVRPGLPRIFEVSPFHCEQQRFVVVRSPPVLCVPRRRASARVPAASARSASCSALSAASAARLAWICSAAAACSASSLAFLSQGSGRRGTVTFVVGASLSDEASVPPTRARTSSKAAAAKARPSRRRARTSRASWARELFLFSCGDAAARRRRTRPRRRECRRGAGGELQWRQRGGRRARRHRRGAPGHPIGPGRGAQIAVEDEIVLGPRRASRRAAARPGTRPRG